MQPLRRVPIVFIWVALFATACSGADAGTVLSTPTESTTAPSGDVPSGDGGTGGDETGRETAATAAASNIGLLRSSDDPRLIEVLDVGDGSITTLATAVTGDRPVLLWFWAPH